MTEVGVDYLNVTTMVPVPTQWVLASRLVQDATCEGFGPVTLASDDQWVIVAAARGWIQEWQLDASTALKTAPLLGENEFRPQGWLHLVDGAFAVRLAGESVWRLIVGEGVPSEANTGPDRDVIAFRGAPSRIRVNRG